jgi:hypothetical protein
MYQEASKGDSLTGLFHGENIQGVFKSGILTEVIKANSLLYTFYYTSLQTEDLSFHTIPLLNPVQNQ